MSYLEEFQAKLDEHNFPKVLYLWEEYCTDDSVDADEFLAILKAVKDSDYVKTFGKYVEAGLPLWQCIKDEKKFYEVLKLLIDLQTTNSPVFADAAYQLLEKHFGNQPEFNERIRLVGLRARDQFQGAITNYELLSHMKKGKFVFHNAGWGTGEVLESSPLREQITVEFEHAPALKHITVKNAFKTLEALPDDHFLARRFGNPDLLEKEGKEDPAALIHLLLRDLGALSAPEIKEEVCELVIPEEDWSRWWQTTRAKLKKDPLIEVPDSIRGAFVLREEKITHEDRLEAAIDKDLDVAERLKALYQLVRDHPHMLKDKEMEDSIRSQAKEILENDKISHEVKLQTWLFLKHFLGEKEAGVQAEDFVKSHDDIISVINWMDITALRKRAMMLIKQQRPDWRDIFLNLFFQLSHAQTRDYLLQELNQDEKGKGILLTNISDLMHKPTLNPDLFVWYFQKILSHGKQEIPFSHKEGLCLFFEAFLILLSQIESKEAYRDLTKKMYLILTNKRYELVRNLIEGASVDYLKEFLLLVAKCHTLTENDKSIMHSLVEVVQPELSGKKKDEPGLMDGNIIWTTGEGYEKIRSRIEEISTKEMIETAKEIEVARSYGDLRENSEYKYALEKRSRLQAEMKLLSEQLNHARILTKEDVDKDRVSVGSIVVVTDSKGQKTTYTILGPWDANPEENVLSFQSRFAKAMEGTRVGESFHFKDEEYNVADLKSFF